LRRYKITELGGGRRLILKSYKSKGEHEPQMKTPKGGEKKYLDTVSGFGMMYNLSLN